jgi:hypothetical protein
MARVTRCGLCWHCGRSHFPALFGFALCVAGLPPFSRRRPAYKTHHYVDFYIIRGRSIWTLPPFRHRRDRVAYKRPCYLTRDCSERDGGIAFGWLFWKWGLESAVVAHFTADVVLHVIFTAIVLYLPNLFP